MPLLVLGGMVGVLVAWGVVLRAFWRQRSWAWWVLVVLEVAGLGVSVLNATSWSVLAALVVLGLLLHPDSREWVRPEASHPVGGDT